MKTANWISKSAKAISVGVLCISVSACGANHNSIYRGFNLVGSKSNGRPTASGHFVDAKQRAVLASQTSTDGTSFYKFCSEPNPDVFAVLSASFAASGSFKTSEEGANAAGQISRAISENGSTIARSQSIQVLRESMYRTCERYLNGGMSEDELAVQALRDQRTIVSILAIEQLTGVSYPPRTAISATAKADTGDTALKIKENLDNERTKLKNREKSQSKLESEHKELGKEVEKTQASLREKTAELEEAKTKLPKPSESGAPSTNSDNKKEEANSSDTENNATVQGKEESPEERVNRLTKEVEEKKKAAGAAQTKAAAKMKELEEAKTATSEQENLVKSLEKKFEAAMSVSSSTAATVKFEDCEKCKPKPPSDEALKAIAASIERIVERTFELDEVEIRCLRQIQSPPKQSVTKIVGTENKSEQLTTDTNQSAAIESINYQKSVEAYEGAKTFCFEYMKQKRKREDAKISADLAKDPKALKLFQSMRESVKEGE